MTAKRRRRAPLNVVGLLVGEVVTFDLAIPDQIFGRTDGYRWTICGLRRGWVPTETGLAVRVERGLDALDDADTIIVPGITEKAWPVPERALAKLRDAHDSGIRIASVCTGAFVLAAAGLLDGRRATTHWRYASLLARMFPAVQVDSGVLYVDEGSVCTSAGLAAGIDMCLHLVGNDFGAALAQKVARNTVVAPHRAGGQAQFIETPTARGTGSTSGLGPIIAYMTASFADPLTVDELADQAAMSPRSFVRHFRAQTGTTPHQWLVHRRLEAARTLLETTDLGVNDVARCCGFGSALVLRQHFARHLDTTPTAYRRTFATP